MHAFDVLGDPVRRRILELLADGEQSSGAITAVIRDEFGISHPAVSQHLRVLRESGFATVRPEGTRRLYAVDSAPLREVDQWLDNFRRFWSQPLDALATELARGRRERRLAAAERAGDVQGRHRDIQSDEGDRPVIDITTQIGAIQREVTTKPAEGGEVVSALLRRRYDAPVEDVWDAVTDPERVQRWFLPVSGDLREGGSFQLEGNAGGRILRCEPPRLLRATFGDESSLVEVRLTPDGDGTTTLELEHTVPLAFAGSGAGALYVGPGWDGTLMALGRFLGGDVTDGHASAEGSPEGVEFSRRSVQAWTAAIEASGTAGPDEIAAAVEASLAQFAPESGAAGDRNGHP